MVGILYVTEQGVTLSRKGERLLVETTQLAAFWVMLSECDGYRKRD